MLSGVGLSSGLVNTFLSLSVKNLGGGLIAGEIVRVAGVLRGLGDAVAIVLLGLKALAVGFGLNSIACTLNLAEVAEGGPRRLAAFCGL